MDPLVARKSRIQEEPVILRTGHGWFPEVNAGSGKAMAFVGIIPARGESVSPGTPTDLVVMDPNTKVKWYLRGKFVPDTATVSSDGRWVAILSEAVPAKGNRGRGLVLLDNMIPGKGEQKITYTYTTDSVPPGPLAMAADGSAIAFVEYSRNHKKAGGPALVVNVIR
jgi:hypothetical protein